MNAIAHPGADTAFLEPENEGSSEVPASIEPAIESQPEPGPQPRVALSKPYLSG